MYRLQSVYTFVRHRYVLAGFYVSVLAVYLLLFGDQFIQALKYPDVLIAPIMSLGSFVAGSTFLGGGAVAFPAMTKIMGTDPFTARTFSFAIQSVGMSAAAIYILARISTLPLRFIAKYLFGTLIGLFLSLSIFDGVFSSADIRVGFTLFVLCFLIIYLWTHKNISNHPEYRNTQAPFDHDRIVFSKTNTLLIIGCGVLGGIISGLIGSGADLLAFCLLALYFRLEIKLATQLSVIIMALTSIAGITLQATYFNNVPTRVIDLWYIAAPIVLFGAPVGAIFCKRTTSRALIMFISLIVSVEVISTVLLVGLEKEKILFYCFVFFTAIVFLKLLFLASPFHIQKRDQENIYE